MSGQLTCGATFERVESAKAVGTFRLTIMKPEEAPSWARRILWRTVRLFGRHPKRGSGVAKSRSRRWLCMAAVQWRLSGDWRDHDDFGENVWGRIRS